MLSLDNNVTTRLKGRYMYCFQLYSSPFNLKATEIFKKCVYFCDVLKILILWGKNSLKSCVGCHFNRVAINIVYILQDWSYKSHSTLCTLHMTNFAEFYVLFMTVTSKCQVFGQCCPRFCMENSQIIDLYILNIEMPWHGKYGLRFFSERSDF